MTPPQRPRSPKAGPGRPATSGRIPPDEIPQGLFYSGALEDRTGLSRTQLQSLQAKGVFKSVAMTTTQRRLYDETCVQAINDHLSNRHAPRRDDDLNEGCYSEKEAVRVFGLLKAGTALVDVVLETELDPRSVEAIAKRFLRMTGALLVPADIMAKVNALPVDGCFPIQDGASLFELIRDLAKERVCIRCRQNSRSERCEGCTKARLVAKMAEARQPAAVDVPQQAGQDPTAQEGP